MKRSHAFACAGCYAVLVLALLFAIFGRTVEQCVRWQG